jgi:hypothetical protein
MNSVMSLSKASATGLAVPNWLSLLGKDLARIRVRFKVMLLSCSKVMWTSPACFPPWNKDECLHTYIGTNSYIKKIRKNYGREANIIR